MLKNLTCILIIITCLSACGGGGESASEPRLPTPAVLVTAGPDASVDELQQLAISGAASGGTGEYTFTWNAPAGIDIEQSGANSPDATLTAPVVTQNTSFDVLLSATDTEGKVGSKAFTLTVLPVNILPQANIQISNIEGYASANYPVNVQVSFDGSASSDGDPQTGEPEIAAYLWQQVSGQDVLAGVDTSLATLSFTTPVSTGRSNAQFMLTVTDQEGGQATARTTITLLGEQGTVPVADAGKLITVFSGELIALAGSASSLAPNAGPFTASWQHDFATSLNINDISSFTTFAQAPLVQTSTVINFELRVFDQFNNQTSDSLAVLVHPQVNTTINDTGVSVNGTADGVTTTYQNDFPGQDAQYGLDRVSASGVIDKTGRGDGGFDFTRLNANGDPVDDINLPFSCVRDNVTGLVWEVKTQADTTDLHYTNQVFTWYQEADNGNFSGVQNAASESCNIANQQCNTSEFVETVNTVGRCGFFDWRIPTHYELQSILHYGKSQAPLLDTDYFPNSGSAVNGQIWYWTRQSSADGVTADIARNAWAIDFATGVDNFLSKSGEYRLRLVRAGRRQAQ
jgi:hypothetical protein